MPKLGRSREVEVAARIREATLKRALGARLTFAMQEAGINRAELALLTGYRESQIADWQEGRATIYPNQVIALCMVLDKTPNWLLNSSVGRVLH